MRNILFLFLVRAAFAAPTLLSSEVSTPVDGLVSSATDTLPTRITDTESAQQAAHFLYDSMSNGTVVGSAIAPLVSRIFLAVEPTATPTSIPDARGRVASTLGLKEGVSVQDTEGSETSEDFFTNALGLVLNGITPSDIQAVLTGESSTANSDTNIGNPNPPTGSNIYPRAGPSDAPYSLSEEQLREAIFIPPTFTYGQKFPVVLIAGTTTTAGVNFASNIGKLLVADGRFDPVYVNVPGENLGDITQTAEYSAYSAHYISALTQNKTAFVTWSKGSIDVQWAFKYWPSTRDKITDSINISPDFHGTTLAYLLCNGITNPLLCDPAIIQQTYLSNFVAKLAKNDGNSAYVPTTTIYSTFDEIVQPQEGIAASGFIRDIRGVGASNNFLQHICVGEPAGGIYTHEGVLYNPATWALVLDALTHDGPGSFDRTTKAPCQDIVAPGISLEDVIETESLIVPNVVVHILAYSQKVYVEPALPAYATY